MAAEITFKVNDRNRTELTNEEIREFANSLTTEKEFFPAPTRVIPRYKLIVGAEINGTLVGVASINRSLGLLNSVSVVKSDFQGKGIGRMLRERQHKLAEDNYDFIISGVWKGNSRQVSLNRTLGYKLIAENREHYFMLCPLNSRGKIVYCTLRSVFLVVGPVGPLIIWLARKLSRLTRKLNFIRLRHSSVAK